MVVFAGVRDTKQAEGYLWTIPLVMAALRPWPQRMLPFWEYAATFLDVATGVAVLPVLAQVLGVYAWARGLFG